MKATWSRLVWVWLSRTCWVWLFAACVGFIGWWLVSRYLEPSPQIIRLTTLLPKEAASFGSHELLFDSTNRWLCVKADVLPGAPRVKRCYVIDLDHPQGVHGSFIWSTLPGSLHTSIARPGGIREVYYQPDGILQIVDRSFLDGSTTFTPLGKVDPSSYVLLTSEGDTVAVVQPWPLWPWMMLANGGLIPCDGAIHASNGCVVDMWNVALHQRTSRHFLGPWIGRLILSQDGNRLVSLESSTQSWQSNPAHSKGIKVTLVPSLPRGIQVLNTVTGHRTKYLTTPREQFPYAAYDAVLNDDQLFVLYSRRLVGKDTVATGILNYGAQSGGLPQISLSTGAETVWPIAKLRLGRYAHEFAPVSMRDRSWMVDYGLEDHSWPEPLVKIASWFNINLNTSYRRSSNLWLQLIDVRSKTERMLISLNVPNDNESHGEWRQPVSCCAESMIFHIQHRAEGSTLYRWKIPCVVYPCWCSVGAGALVSVLILVVYHRRRQRHQA